jgi:hypothetical protein
VARWIGRRLARPGIEIDERTFDPGDAIEARALVDRSGRAWCVLPAVGGPAALRSLAGAIGWAARAEFVGERRGIDAALLADPAHSVAAEVLVRRLALCPAFLDAAGVRLDVRALQDLGVEEAMAPRRAWAYLSLAVEDARSADPRVDERWMRAVGRPALPDERVGVAETDPAASAELRGTALGLLIEERLRTRHGRRWFDERAAVRWLWELWEADADQTAEEMAAALDLGTIDPAPVLDACRPARAVRARPRP